MFAFSHPFYFFFWNKSMYNPIEELYEKKGEKVSCSQKDKKKPEKVKIEKEKNVKPLK